MQLTIESILTMIPFFCLLGKIRVVKGDEFETDLETGRTYFVSSEAKKKFMARLMTIDIEARKLAVGALIEMRRHQTREAYGRLSWFDRLSVRVHAAFCSGCDADAHKIF